MPADLKVQEIFTPNDTPTVTYIDRSEHKLEQRIRDYYETPNVVVSVSGPSKSGKTVLIKKVVPE
jgi:Ni2+-binding GTPase involved in maturation of urease and hydrogenase